MNSEAKASKIPYPKTIYPKCVLKKIEKIIIRFSGKLIIVVVVKIFGLLRDLVLANVYQTTAISDAFLIAFSIPSVLFALLGKSIATSYLPVFLETKKDKNEIEAEKYTTKICIYGAAICAMLCLLIFIFPNQIIRLFASGFDDGTVEMCKNMLFVGIFSIFFMFLSV